MKFISTLLAIGLVCIALITINPRRGFSHSYGAPEGFSGSPFDGGTCSRPYCHLGNVTEKEGMIAIDVPATGYEAGKEYNVTAGISQAGGTTFGFEVSPRFYDGSPAGILTPVDSSTQLATNEYITHTLAGSKGINGRQWKFKWTAPQHNSGAVTFYGSFLTPDISGQGGYAIFTSNVATGEEGKLGFKNFTDAGITIFPLPMGNTLKVKMPAFEWGDAVTLFSLGGVQVAESYIDGTGITELNTDGLAQGVYILRVETGKGFVSQIVMK